MLALAACDGEPSEPDGTWRAGAPLPMGARWSPVTAWTGDELIVVGGGTDSPCPPNASCVAADPMARDGAAYDPASDTWRAIAEAPMPIGYWFRPVVVGQRLVLFDGGRRWLAYDLAADRWSRLPEAPTPLTDSGAIPALDGRIHVVAEDGRVLALNVLAERWDALPLDGRRPRLRPYAVQPTDDGVFVCSADADGFTVVDRWDGAAWSERFPTTGSVGNLCEHWTGRRLVSADLQTAPGLEGDPPYGGRLDVATGAWSPLPHAPEAGERPDDGWHPVAADGPSIAGWGYVYDDDAETWTLLGRPDSEVDTQQGAVWADESLVVVGGIDEATAYDDPSGLSAEMWLWTP